jgi:hypothetical protein
MFQYISDILKQFTSAQKLLVLIILLISIVGISYITMITKNPKELSEIVSTQRKQIIKDQQYIFGLSDKISSLNDSILKVSQDCNDKAIEREKVYAQKMIEQQQYVTKTIDEIKRMMMVRDKIEDIKPLKMQMQEYDTSYVEVKPIVTVTENNDIDSKIINKLDNIKRKVKSN